jgi:predicted SnoaL-like aldol condensation-catalyzing enzyme
MEYATLGNTGLLVSKLCFGTTTCDASGIAQTDVSSTLRVQEPRPIRHLSRGLPQKGAYETVLRDVLSSDLLDPAGIYIQHRAHIAPGREGLFDLIKSLPPTLKYEPGTIVAEGDFVIVHGRFSGFGAPVNWIAADIVRIKDGVLVEHWDVIQDEATQEQSKSGQPMFGRTFATYAGAR